MDQNAAAKLALVNGRVYTMDAARRWASAVAVSQGQIVGVGTDAAVRELIGPGTDVVDLGGRMLLPGFQDAHVHPPSSGLELLQCNLHDVHGIDEYVAAVREYSAPSRVCAPRGLAPTRMKRFVSAAAKSPCGWVASTSRMA